MPYISKTARPTYDEVVLDLLDNSTDSNWAPRVAALIFMVAADLYGGPKETRYFKQNEFLGVLFAAALESGRRLDAQISIMAIPDDWRKKSAEIERYVARVLSVIPREDATERPGHLNYLTTELVNDAAKRGWLRDPGSFIAGLGHAWYQHVTGPYEDGAIAKNGDTPGYMTLLGRS